jgi:hypothetical protein
LVLLRHKRKSFGKIKKVNNFIKNCEEFIIKWQGYVPLPGLHVTEKKPKVHLPLKLSRLVLRKVNLKMITMPCHLNPATYSLGGPLLPKMICLS